MTYSELIKGAYLEIAKKAIREIEQQRVVDEKAELDDKITKLTTFINGDICKMLEHREQELLSK